ncbi:PE-PPE domain-containing protein [Mycobacterium shimoidei]|uniref:PPE family protein PPE28 [Mycobacterium tuberculosis H37Rv] n=1 Tax=Mycobacterium shimoidei TaxID=29313 RepID=A0A1E3TI40_MYCSH|nr:PE-PPE domain-containing protein [Mycobacterium shimoidei]MCV7257978.1 PE-PPE domain-containing protein [Mycobacterium shimoidei]ODR14087.1 PE-PPE domain-containing protein [Mycobacterium shimoidei]ORW84016.1 PE family protein [Mycobacterium shimoidei]SRX91781.1 PPE family protein PPE28 [Mycobacterium tuberculosis H37Rv] [Mycobacterium shimoidei]
MTRPRLGVAALVITASVGSSVLYTSTPMSPAGPKTVLAETNLVDTESWIMGGSGLPIPPPSYLDALSARYIDPTPPFFAGQPQFAVDATNPLFTPEGLYPNSGVKSLELDPSLAQGLSILHNTINNEIAEGNNLVVLGYSQSATISTLEMRDLLALPPAEQPTPDQLSFVLLGDPNLPNGGLFERFNLPAFDSFPTIPSLGITFSGATPADTPWETAIYTMEYDGYADFPRYPINLLADLNAVLGIQYVHTIYPSLTDEQLASAIELPVSADYTGNTDYFMIPDENLPLLQPLLSIPVIGQPLYDLLEPDMRILVNLGYGSITNGWDPGPANVPAPFELFPTNLDPAEVLTALQNGAQQGFQDFINDLGSLSSADFGAAAPTVVLDELPSFTEIVNAISSAAASAYATLLPTADLLNALLIETPAYAATVFADELAAGDLVDAIGLPIAGLFGLGSIALGFEYIVIAGAAAEIAADFQSLFS